MVVVVVVVVAVVVVVVVVWQSRNNLPNSIQFSAKQKRLYMARKAAFETLQAA